MSLSVSNSYNEKEDQILKMRNELNFLMETLNQGLNFIEKLKKLPFVLFRCGLMHLLRFITLHFLLKKHRNRLKILGYSAKAMLL